MGPEERKKLGRAARQRIMENFEIGKVVGEFERLYEELIADSS